MKLAILFVVGCLAHIGSAGEYTDRFLQQYNKIHNSANGYFSSQGIPYHSRETLVVEAPDHGHETTSEAYSYYIYLEAMAGAINGDFSPFNKAWQLMEQYMIPTNADQPTNSQYNPSAPATFAPELDNPSDYPSPMHPEVPVGQDPLYQELVSTYGTADVYLMHWLSDVDNVYGFGNSPGSCEAGPSAAGPSYINTFQRGPEESVWRTIPQPTCDAYKYGGPNGFLDLFVQDNSYAQQWKFTSAPDAEARAIQGAYWAAQWADAKGQLSSISDTLAKAGKMGDYLRYALFDKYFKKIGNCVGPTTCPGGTGKDSAHYLLSWYAAWGGSLTSQNGWSWRIGDGTAHFGYQNPLAAYVLANDPNIKPKSPTGASDWATSLSRQLELYQWLQTSQGAFAGGVTNTINGRYDTPTSNLTGSTFHGMFYDWEPVYHDPPSNRWYGMQPWSVDRLAQYYYVSGDAQAKTLLDKWVAWVLSETKFSGGTYSIPENLSWNGVPPSVTVTVSATSADVGTGSATARALAYYAAKSGDSNAKSVAKQLLDVIWTDYQTNYGVSHDEEREDYGRFNEPVYVPSSFSGTYPNGDQIKSGATFLSLRSWFKNDPNFSLVQNYLNGGAVPKLTIHRFWAQADIAIAQGAYGLLFNE